MTSAEIDAKVAAAQTTFDEMLASFPSNRLVQTIVDSCVRGDWQPVGDANAVARESIGAKLIEISASAGIDELPADVAVWLQVLLCNGKDFSCFSSFGVLDEYEKANFWFKAQEFLSGDPDPRLGGQSGGLVYLYIWYEDYGEAFFFIDAGGEVAKMNGEPGVGAVYVARVYDEENLPLTAAFWKEGRKPVHIIMGPTRVAASVTDFFKSLIGQEGRHYDHIFVAIEGPEPADPVREKQRCKEELEMQARDQLRAAGSAEELRCAIENAERLGLTNEVAIGQRKLSKMLGTA